jgi:hypothetical protein
MKSQYLLSCRLVLLLVMGAFWSGCAQESKDAGRTETSPAQTAPAATNTVARQETSMDEPAPIQKISATPVSLAPAVAEVVKLAEAGVSEDVTIGFIDNSAVVYNLGVDDILYLYDIGISPEVITAMMRHDAEVQNKQATASELAAQISDQQTNIMLELADIKDTLAKEAVARQSTQPETANAPVTPAPTPQTAPAPASEAVTQPVYANLPQEVSYFYTDLAPYGSWYELPGYGWCWQPRVVELYPAWRPYCDRGRWLWTDCGWYWQSDYSWGWAPFHYGRWHRHPSIGWVWFPHTSWAPAWVSWRYTDDYCGWAPLPPGAHFTVGVGFTNHGTHVGVDFGFGLAASHFTFVSWKHFLDRHPRHYALAPAQASHVYRNCTVINNYVAGNNNTIINEGVGIKRVAAATQMEIRKAQVRDLPPNAGKYVRPDRPERTASGTVVYRPRLTEPPSPKASLVANQAGVRPVPAQTTIPGRSSESLSHKQSENRTPSSAAAPVASPPQVRPGPPSVLTSRPSAGYSSSASHSRDSHSSRAVAPVTLAPRTEEPKAPTPSAPSLPQPTADTRRLLKQTTPQPSPWRTPSSPSRPYSVNKPYEARRAQEEPVSAPTYSAPKPPIIISSPPRVPSQPSVPPPAYRNEPAKNAGINPNYRAPATPIPRYQSPARSYTPSYQPPARSYTPPSASPNYAPPRPSYSPPPAPARSAPAVRVEPPRISSSGPSVSAAQRSSPPPSPSPSRSPSVKER